MKKMTEAIELAPHLTNREVKHSAALKMQPNEEKSFVQSDLSYFCGILNLVLIVGCLLFF